MNGTKDLIARLLEDKEIKMFLSHYLKTSWTRVIKNTLIYGIYNLGPIHKRVEEIEEIVAQANKCSEIESRIPALKKRLNDMKNEITKLDDTIANTDMSPSIQIKPNFEIIKPKPPDKPKPVEKPKVIGNSPKRFQQISDDKRSKSVPTVKAKVTVIHPKPSSDWRKGDNTTYIRETPTSTRTTATFEEIQNRYNPKPTPKEIYPEWWITLGKLEAKNTPISDKITSQKAGGKVNTPTKPFGKPNRIQSSRPMIRTKVIQLQSRPGYGDNKTDMFTPSEEEMYYQKYSTVNHPDILPRMYELEKRKRPTTSVKRHYANSGWAADYTETFRDDRDIRPYSDREWPRQYAEYPNMKNDYYYREEDLRYSEDQLPTLRPQTHHSQPSSRLIIHEKSQPRPPVPFDETRRFFKEDFSQVASQGSSCSAWSAGIKDSLNEEYPKPRKTWNRSTPDPSFSLHKN